MTVAGTLVWLRGQRGPEPQRWPVGTTAHLRSENRDRILAEHPLNEGEFGLAICILEQRYSASKVTTTQDENSNG
jgi:hypothetical protein